MGDLPEAVCGDCIAVNAQPTPADHGTRRGRCRFRPELELIPADLPHCADIQVRRERVGRTWAAARVAAAVIIAAAVLLAAAQWRRAPRGSVAGESEPAAAEAVPQTSSRSATAGSIGDPDAAANWDGVEESIASLREDAADVVPRIERLWDDMPNSPEYAHPSGRPFADHPTQESLP